MGVAYDAVQVALGIANDNSHGYDQANRWGPDYDCSSFVITAYKKAGVPLTCTYTGNMYSDMISKGFKNVTNAVNLATGAGLEVGDVLLNVASHTAMCIGNGMIVQAGSNEFGGVTGGHAGDQTGNEIRTRPYYNFPWNYVLRYSDNSNTSGASVQKPSTQDSNSELQNGIYTVKRGDTLWGIAEKFYGNGSEYARIMKDNGLTSSFVQIGQRLKIGDNSASTPKQDIMYSRTCTPTLPILKYGDYGLRVRRIQALLVSCGFQLKIDGDYGDNTKQCIELLQQSKNIPVNGVVDAKTYEALLS